MISDYIHPQLLIRQNLQVVGTDAVERMNVLVVGPQYVFTDLEQDTLSKSTFNDEGGTINLRFTDPEGETFEAGEDNILDETSVKVFVDGVQAELLDSVSYTVGEFGADFTAARSAPRALVATAGLVRNTEDTTGLITGLRGRNVAVGDKVVFEHEDWAGIQHTRTVTGFVPQLEAAVYGSNEAGDDEFIGLAPNNPQTTVSSSVAFLTTPSNFDTDNAFIPALTDAEEAVAGVGSYFTELGAKYSGEIITYTLLQTPTPGDTVDVSYTTSRGFFSGTASATLIDTGTGYELELSGGIFGTVEAFVIPLVAEIAPEAGDTFVIKFIAEYAETFIDRLTLSGTYTREETNTVRITVVEPAAAGNVTLRISDEVGAFAAYNVNVPTPIGAVVNVPISNTGVTLIVSRATLVTANVGAVYFVKLTPATASTTKFNGVLLNAPVEFKNSGSTSETFYTRFRKEYTGEYTPEQYQGELWTAETAGGVTTLDYGVALTLFDNGRSAGYKYPLLADGVGKIYATWRGQVVPTANEKAFLIESSDTVDEFLGRVSPINDIAYAAQLAKQGSQNRRVYALRTNGTNAAAFSEAIKRVERNDLVYAIAVITDDIEAIKVVADHCTAMSEPDIKNFRRCYYGSDSPGEYTVVDKDNLGVPYRATVTDYSGSPRLVNFTTDPFLVAKDVKPGDFFSIRGAQYEIEEVFSSTSLLLVDALDDTINPSEEAKIVKADNVDNTLDYIISRSVGINNRRAVNVWCEDGVGLDQKGNYFVIPNRFVAAEIAGLRVAQVPWIGLSKTEITSIVEAPIMYTKYTTADLDRAAANGVWIVAQDLEGGDVFIRHQLTTDVSNGILYYEDSVGTNYDNISFQIKDGLDSTVVGKRNVNRETLAYVNSKVFEILKEATMSDAGSTTGPQLISFQDANANEYAVTVSVHPTFKDRIMVKGKLEMPVPSNIVDVDLEAVIGLTL